MWNMELQILRKQEIVPSNLVRMLKYHHLHLHLITWDNENLTIPQAAVWTTLLWNIVDIRLKSEIWKTQGRGWKSLQSIKISSGLWDQHGPVEIGGAEGLPLCSFLASGFMELCTQKKAQCPMILSSWTVYSKQDLSSEPKMSTDGKDRRRGCWRVWLVSEQRRWAQPRSWHSKDLTIGRLLVFVLLFCFCIPSSRISNWNWHEALYKPYLTYGEYPNVSLEKY